MPKNFNRFHDARSLPASKRGYRERIKLDNGK